MPPTCRRPKTRCASLARLRRRAGPAAGAANAPRGAVGGAARCAPSRSAAPGARAAAPRAAVAAAAPAVRLARFEDVVALARAKRDIQLQAALENDVRLVRFEAGSDRIFAASRRFAADRADPVAPAAGMDRRALDGGARRGRRTRRRCARAPTAQEAERLSGVAADPLVRKVWRVFPAPDRRGARRPKPRCAAAGRRLRRGDDEVAYADAVIVEDDA